MRIALGFAQGFEGFERHRAVSVNAPDRFGGAARCGCSQRRADVFGQRADVVPLLQRTSSTSARDRLDDVDRVNRHAARFALDLDAGAGIFVERLAWCLSAECIGGGLISISPVKRAQAASTSARVTFTGASATPRPSIIAPRRLANKFQRGEITLVGVQAGLRKTWSPRRSRSAAARWPADPACRVAGLLGGAVEALGAAGHRCSTGPAACRAAARRAPARLGTGVAALALSRPWPASRWRLMRMFNSAARSVVRSKWKCSVGTVWICRRLNRPLRR